MPPPDRCPLWGTMLCAIRKEALARRCIGADPAGFVVARSGSRQCCCPPPLMFEVAILIGIIDGGSIYLRSTIVLRIDKSCTYEVHIYYLQTKKCSHQAYYMLTIDSDQIFLVAQWVLFRGRSRAPSGLCLARPAHGFRRTGTMFGGKVVQ